MKVSLGASGFAVLCALACGSTHSLEEHTAKTAEPIQDGMPDTTNQYPFVVAVIENSQHVGLCSGSLLAPNLVATARHCVTALSGPNEIDCATSTFGSDLPLSDFLVTNDVTLSSKTRFVGVRQLVVPTGAEHTKVCGNDIALLILDQNVAVPQYVTPTLNPPMTDPRYSISVTAIGYGIDTPLDMTGMSAGTRRVRENVGLACVPNDPSFAGCYGEATVSEFLEPDEFVSGDASTCEGDSGSGAFDQGSFDRGQWVSFGVLSRGATDLDSGTCVQPIYSRFDAWAQLLVDGATQAATFGGYPVPAWAQVGVATSDAGAGTVVVAPEQGDANVSSGGGAEDDAGHSAGVAVLSDGAACADDGQCQSHNCVSTDDMHFFCASPCAAGACSAGFRCLSGFCFDAPDASPSGPAEALKQKSGCSVVAIGAVPPDPLHAARSAVILLAALALLRRQRRAAGFQTHDGAHVAAK
jgi:secreted trypsin-like serine protease